MRRCLTAILSGLSLAAVSTPVLAELRITVDKSTQRMTVAVDGQPRYVWPVSTGLGGYDTPGGTYQPFRMEAEHFSREWDNAPMPHAVFFTKIGHAIHGTNQVRNLGRAASHGCIRLAPGNAAVLFGLVRAQGMANTHVTVEGEVEPAVASYRGRDARRVRYVEDGDGLPPAPRAGRGVVRYRDQPAFRTGDDRDPFGDGRFGYRYGYGYDGY